MSIIDFATSKIPKLIPDTFVSPAKAASEYLGGLVSSVMGTMPPYAIALNKVDLLVNANISSVDADLMRSTTRHPVENGFNISDHVFIEPTMAMFSVVIDRRYKDTINKTFNMVRDTQDVLTVRIEGVTLPEPFVVQNISFKKTEETMDTITAEIRLIAFMNFSPTKGKISASTTKVPSAPDTSRSGVVSGISYSMSTAFGMVSKAIGFPSK